MKQCKICPNPTNGYKNGSTTAFCSLECFRVYNNDKVKKHYATEHGHKAQLDYEKNRNTKQCKINPKKYHKPWSDEDIAKLLRLRKDKYTYAQLVCEFDGRTINSVKAKLKTLNRIYKPNTERG